MEGLKTQPYNEEVMIRFQQSESFDDLKQAGCVASTDFNLTAFADEFWTYSHEEDLECSSSNANGYGGCIQPGEKCSFLPTDFKTGLDTRMCATGVDNSMICLMSFTLDGQLKWNAASEEGIVTPGMNLFSQGEEDPTTLFGSGTGASMRDILNIWTHESCPNSATCNPTCHSIPQSMESIGGNEAFNNGRDCEVVFEPGNAECTYKQDWKDNSHCCNYDQLRDNDNFQCGWTPELEKDGQCGNGRGQPQKCECNSPIPSATYSKEDYLYLDNMNHKDFAQPRQPVNSDQARRLAGRANSRRNFDCKGHLYTNAGPIAGVENGVVGYMHTGEKYAVECDDFDGSSPYIFFYQKLRKVEGVSYPPTPVQYGQYLLNQINAYDNGYGQLQGPGCSGRFCGLNGQFGPIINRVNKTAFLNFVSMDNLKKKWSNFNIMLAPKTYCHPYSDELAMMHLLAKYGEFNVSAAPLSSIMGAPDSGAVNGWYDIISIDYGAPCDYPFMKHVPGHPDQPMEPCCVHAYTDEDTCKVDLQREAAGVISPGIGTIRSPSPSNDDLTLLPWQELSCPLEVTIDDDRSPGMSLKQQFGSVSVSASKLVADQTGTMNALGRGCYMCVTPSVNTSLYETLNTKTNWLDHYDPVTCATKSVIPTMEFVPKSDSGTNGAFDTITIDPTERFRPSRQFPTSRDEIAGVYTLYPYIDIPAQLPKEQVNDTTVQSNYQKLLSLQLKYYHDVDYHIKVEVTGTSA